MTNSSSRRPAGAASVFTRWRHLQLRYRIAHITKPVEWASVPVEMIVPDGQAEARPTDPYVRHATCEHIGFGLAPSMMRDTRAQEHSQCLNRRVV